MDTLLLAMASPNTSNNPTRGLEEQLGDIKSNLERIQKAKRKAVRKQQTFLPHYQLGIVKFIVALGAWNVDNGMAYVAHKHLLSQEEEKSALRITLELWVGSLGAADKDRYLVGGGGTKRSAQYRSATKFLREMKLHEW